MDKQTIELWNKLAAGGATMQAIADYYGVNPKTVAAHTTTRRHGMKLTDKDVKEILKWRAKGWKLAAIARQYGVSESWVSKLCRIYNVTKLYSHGKDYR